jgi:mannitol/fructose-specific phosphotransferase system IIA component
MGTASWTDINYASDLLLFDIEDANGMTIIAVDVEMAMVIGVANVDDISLDIVAKLVWLGNEIRHGEALFTRRDVEEMQELTALAKDG